jgi:hypothetical protein
MLSNQHPKDITAETVGREPAYAMSTNKATYRSMFDRLGGRVDREVLRFEPLWSSSIAAWPATSVNSTRSLALRCG